MRRPLSHGSDSSRVGSASLSSRSHGPFGHYRYARVHGISDQQLARCSDVHLSYFCSTTVPGAVFGYGHVAFESGGMRVYLRLAMSTSQRSAI